MLEAVGCFHDERSTACAASGSCVCRIDHRAEPPVPGCRNLPRSAAHVSTPTPTPTPTPTHGLPSNRWRRHRRECSGPDRDERRATFRASKGPARQTGSISHDHESGPSDARGRQQDGFAARLRRLFPRPHRSGSREAVGFHGTFRNSVAWPVLNASPFAREALTRQINSDLRCSRLGRASPGLPAERGGRRVAAKETLSCSLINSPKCRTVVDVSRDRLFRRVPRRFQQQGEAARRLVCQRSAGASGSQRRRSDASPAHPVVCCTEIQVGKPNRAGRGGGW